MQLPRPPRQLLSFFLSSSRPRRGQLTAEWLMLLLLAISLLAIASVAISNASAAQTSLAERNMLRMELEEMGHYADEICVMGAGNARTVALAPVAFNLSYDETSHNLTIRGRNFAYSRTQLCPVELADSNGYADRAYLQYAELGSAGGNGGTSASSGIGGPSGTGAAGQAGRPGTSISKSHP